MISHCGVRCIIYSIHDKINPTYYNTTNYYMRRCDLKYYTALFMKMFVYDKALNTGAAIWETIELLNNPWNYNSVKWRTILAQFSDLANGYLSFIWSNVSYFVKHDTTIIHALDFQQQRTIAPLVAMQLVDTVHFKFTECFTNDSYEWNDTARLLNKI